MTRRFDRKKEWIDDIKTMIGEVLTFVAAASQTDVMVSFFNFSFGCDDDDCGDSENSPMHYLFHTKQRALLVI